ncbi:response regulator [Phototrophicus methaneseepsis]|uniref:Response regulator n=1 Tax=Phototrophicus methaneseepsis TaxID=2710758 RepID=A0A7S8E7F8_9CHLR|nr:response regulator [Phototrophicus methaneseepsis]QPC81744.1 response regulator [Phototrophicus methaneseepsis]
MKRVLVVEDNEDNLTLMLDVLGSLELDVITATDGDQGVALAQQERPDLILMDLSLPRMDGWTATRIIKADETLRDIPVIALTAHAMVGDKERALQAGCDDYLPKPLNLKELAQKLSQYIG